MAKEQGLSLHDIAPLYENIPYGDVDMLRVYGVSAKDILQIFLRFPMTHAWVSGAGIDPGEMARVAPEAMAAIIASGCHALGDEEAEKRASELPAEVQLDCLEAIGRLTFRSGFGPFVKRVFALAAVAASENFGRGRGTNSQPQSKPLSPAVTEPKTSGS
jgi:hypothetical protein